MLKYFNFFPYKHFITDHSHPGLKLDFRVEPRELLSVAQAPAFQLYYSSIVGQSNTEKTLCAADSAAHIVSSQCSAFKKLSGNT
jgi:hypothetical protein